LFYFIIEKIYYFPPNRRWARRNFEMRGANILKSLLNKAHNIMKKPSWLAEDVCDNLCQSWGSKPFKVKILTYA